jgi:hypothetical protein
MPAAPKLGLELQLMEVKGTPGLTDMLAVLKREHADAFFVFPGPLLARADEVIE